METAYLGGGCFWCVEAVLERLKGVEDVTSGYMGGSIANPTDHDIYHKDTGHVEVVRVRFDPAVISYETLLAVYFSSHDPTSVNKQGNDVGEQYRSVIFVTSDKQRREAREYIARLDADGVYGKPIITNIEKAMEFYEADEHHQNYYRRNEGNGYCSVVISPKVAKLRKEFAHLLQENDPE